MNINKIALIGGSIVGAGALAYFLLRSGKKEATSSTAYRVLSRETVIAVVKSLKKELFAVVMQISMMAQQMKQYSQGKLDYDIKDFIFSYPAINQEIQSSIDKAYRKNGVTEQELQYNCETTFKDDKEVQALMASIRTMIDNAAEGKEIDMKTELPEFLTSETLLSIIEKIMRETTKHMQGIFKKIKDQYGELNLNDPRIAQQLQTLQADDIKTTIFAEYNLEEFDDPAQKIVSFATQKFAQESPEFQHKMMQLELKQRKSMESIMKDPTTEGVVDKIFSEEAPSMGPAGGSFPGFHAQRRRQAPAAAATAATTATTTSSSSSVAVVEEKAPEVASAATESAPAVIESAPVAEESAVATAPVVEENAPVVAEEVAPVIAEEVVPVIAEEVAPVVQEVAPAVQEVVAPVVQEAAVEKDDVAVVEAPKESAHSADNELQESAEQVHSAIVESEAPKEVAEEKQASEVQVAQE